MTEFKDHLIRAITANVRYDGRANDEYRPIDIKYNISSTAEGSAQVTIGGTVIIAGVKLDVATPYPDTPDQGTLMVDAQLLPLSSPLFEQGPPDIDAIELARVIDRGIRESKCIDLSSLCIKKGEKVWTVSVDLCTLNADGNLFDAAGLAVVAAIQNAKLPKLTEEGKVDYHEKTSKSLSLQKVPIAVTIWKVGDTLVVDPTQKEENVFNCRLTVTTTEDGVICAMQKGGEGTLTAQEVVRMIDMAIVKADELRKHL